MTDQKIASVETMNLIRSEAEELFGHEVDVIISRGKTGWRVGLTEKSGSPMFTIASLFTTHKQAAEAMLEHLEEWNNFPNGPKTKKEEPKEELLYSEYNLDDVRQVLILSHIVCYAMLLNVKFSVWPTYTNRQMLVIKRSNMDVVEQGVFNAMSAFEEVDPETRQKIIDVESSHFFPLSGDGYETEIFNGHNENTKSSWAKLKKMAEKFTSLQLGWTLR